VTDDLVEWLRLQLDDNETHARKDLWAVEHASNQGDWTAHYGYNLPFSELRAGDELIGRLAAHIEGLRDGGEDQHRADALLVVRLVRSAKDRAERALREVEAKRRIVDSFAAGMEFEPLRRGTEQYAIVRMVLKLLALPYSDRPGYREDWRP
jgi:hypothetical protein